jgi:hypothetical protein
MIRDTGVVGWKPRNLRRLSLSGALTVFRSEWQEIWRLEDDQRYRGGRLDIKKSQKTLSLRSINCIPVGVAGNMEVGG